MSSKGIKVGMLAAVVHSIWVSGLGLVGARNIEMQFAWRAQELFDSPVGLLAERFRSMLLHDSGPGMWWTFHSANVVFFLLAGGGQFFVWGYLVGTTWARWKASIGCKRGRTLSTTDNN